MINISIDKKLKELCPALRLGCIEAHVKVEESSSDLWNELNDYSNELLSSLAIENISSIENIKCGRDLYKSLHKAPGKYRMSSEALLRRVLQKKGIYRINNIVEINNLISLKSKLPVGSYNLDNLSNNITLSVGTADFEYKGIGKEFINIENLPVLCDDKGPFGSATSDSERAMITESVSHIMMVIFSFNNNEISEYIDLGCSLLEKNAHAYNVNTKIFL